MPDAADVTEPLDVKQGALRVLVLDDESAARNLVDAVLTCAGCVVESAADGREGLDILLQKPFDVLVVDLRMKGMDGFTFLEEARKIWPWLGVVIVSGHVNGESTGKAGSLGITRIVEKPFHPDKLQQAVFEEAKSRQEQLARVPEHSPEQIRYQLGLLRHLGESAIAGQSVVEALSNLSAGLARLLPCALVGILDIENDKQFLALNAKQPVSRDFIRQIEGEILARFRALSGRALTTDSIQTRIEGTPPAETGIPKARSILIVPVIAQGHLHGLLVLASGEPDAYSVTDASFLYHAANQLSTVMTSLNQMQQLAIRDPLTSLYNRRQLEEVLNQTWLLVSRYDLDMSLAVVDLDNLKPLNDTYGHAAGDGILREFADILLKLSRASDTLARSGGDEFIVILPKASENDARAFAERLLRTARDHVFCEHNLKLRITCTIGLADIRSAPPPTSAVELLARADAALYAAKRAGRDRLAMWSQDLETAPGAKASPGTPSPTVPAPERHAAMRGRVLVVDDEELILYLLQRILEGESFHVETATSAAQALALVKQAVVPFDILLTDIHMQEMSGIDLMQEIHALDTSLVKIAITGHATVDNAVASLRTGAYDFIEKPLHHEHLIAVMNRALEYRRLVRENARYQSRLEEMVREKSAALARSLEETRQSHEFSLEAMAALLDAREHATGAHSKRVHDLTLILGREMNVSPQEALDLGHGSLLHDIGKIAVPDAVLLKPGPLTEEEWRVMKTHPEVGYRILTGSPHLHGAAEIVLAHHERFDGSGYPHGLKGSDICLGARIFAVADAYDTIRSWRSYRGSRPPAEAIGEILKGSGTQFDPKVVAAFQRCCPLIETAGQWDAH